MLSHHCRKKCHYIACKGECGCRCIRRVVWHGEGRSVVYHVNTQAPESEQPAVVMSRVLKGT
jgi:hypothetical protein